MDVHQLNCTYHSSLGEDDERYLAARAIQLFAKGVPQVYYVGLLAGLNDLRPSPETGRVGRSTDTTTRVAEIEEALQRPVVLRLLELVRLRNTHLAFDGELCVESDREGSIRMRWQHHDAQLALEVDIARGHSELIDGGLAKVLTEGAASPRK